MPYWYSDPVDLGVETDGNYMVNVAAGTGIYVSHVPAEGSTATVSLDASLDNLNNVTVPSPATNDILKWNGTAWVNGSSTLDSLSDVTVPTPTTGDFLKWNGTAWVNDPSLGTTVTAHRMTATVTNADSVTLVRGDVVYMFGAAGNRASVKLASNVGDSTSSKTFGIVEDTIAPNNTGTMVTVGVIDGINLGSYTDGDTLWLDSTPGKFTKTKPSAPNHTVFLGVVERANAGNGQIYVKVQNGYELGELHNVSANNGIVVDNDLLQYDSATQLWKNTTPATVANDMVLDNLGNVTVPSPVSNDLLRWNGTAWVNTNGYAPLASEKQLYYAGAAETFNRLFGIATGRTYSTGNTYLTALTPNENVTATGITVYLTTAGATFTLVRLGLYTFDGTTYTLVARTADVKATFNVNNASVTSTFNTTGGYPASYSLIAGTTYYVGIVQVATTPATINGPTTPSSVAGISSLINTGSPKLCRSIAGQTDLATTYAEASMNNSVIMAYARLS